MMSFRISQIIIVFARVLSATRASAVDEAKAARRDKERNLASLASELSEVEGNISVRLPALHHAPHRASPCVTIDCAPTNLKSKTKTKTKSNGKKKT